LRGDDGFSGVIFCDSAPYSLGYAPYEQSVGFLFEVLEGVFYHIGVNIAFLVVPIKMNTAV
jgi:hypothetical protein